MGLIKIAIDRQNKALVSYNGSVTVLPPFYQTNEQEFQIQIVDPVGGLFQTTYEVVDCSASDLRMVLAQSVTGDETDNAELMLAATYEAGWTWDADLDAFTGVIDFHTQEFSEYLGVLASQPAILEINLVTGGTPETILGARSGESNVTINANADDGSASAPSIIAQAETVGIFTIQHGVGGVTLDANLVTITGLGLAGTPSAVYIWVICPADNGFIGGNFQDGSASTAGFSVRLSGVPPTNTYKIRYVLTF